MEGWAQALGYLQICRCTLFDTVLSSATVVELSARRSKNVLSSVSVGIATSASCMLLSIQS